MTMFQRWKHTALHNKALVWSGVLVAFGTVFYAGAAAFQVHLMRLGAKDQAAQFDKIAQKVDGFIAQMNAANTLGRLALEETGKSLETSLVSSAQQSRAALDAGVETSRNDQRAWLTPFDARRLPEDERHMQVLFRNSGRSPAIEVRVFIGWAALETRIPHYDSDPVGSPEVPTFIMAPGVISNSSPIIPDPVIDAIVSGQAGGYVFGTIWYDDVFNRDHWTQFCYKINGRFSAFVPCSGHNTCDDCQRSDKAKKQHQSGPASARPENRGQRKLNQ